MRSQGGSQEAWGQGNDGKVKLTLLRTRVSRYIFTAKGEFQKTSRERNERPLKVMYKFRDPLFCYFNS